MRRARSAASSFSRISSAVAVHMNGPSRRGGCARVHPPGPRTQFAPNPGTTVTTSLLGQTISASCGGLAAPIFRQPR